MIRCVNDQLLPSPQDGSKDTEEDKIRSEFAAIDDQLNGVERYAMRYLEEENAGAAAEQLKQAEVLLVCFMLYLQCNCVHTCTSTCMW